MLKLFISYRRNDTAVITDRIYDRLVAMFGKRAVFRDINDIPAGKDFRVVLENEVGKSNIMLVIIGPQWANISNTQGSRRLSDPNDFVRIEVESGLNNKGTLVIPVLVMGASMPNERELPESLRQLSYRNAVIVRNDPDFDHDMGRLLHLLKSTQPLTKRIAPVITVGFSVLFLLILMILVGIKTWGGSSIVQPTTSLSSVLILPTSSPQVNIIKDGIAQRSFQIYEEPNSDALVIKRVNLGDQITILESTPDGLWNKIRLSDGSEGWGLAEGIKILSGIKVGAGYGVRGDFWEVYFTAPLDNPNPESPYGIDARLAAAIDAAKTSIDVAAYEFDNIILTDAIIQASKNGVRVRVVTDNKFGIGDPNNTFSEMEKSGIPVVADESSFFMHNKFMIIDGKTVWTGSWNYTEIGTYEQNNNTIMFISNDIVSLYQAEFDEMFIKSEFGSSSPVSTTNDVTVGEKKVEVFFSPEDNVGPRLLDVIGSAKRSIRVMAFVITDDSISSTILSRAGVGVDVQGIVEERLSPNAGQFMKLYCSGLDFRFDGNPQYLHHKVIIIDNEIVITGSANFSLHAFKSNDENIVIVHDKYLASAYDLEFDRILKTAQKVDIPCATPMQ